MTDNDSIKALEIHANRGSCADCPYSKMEMGLCQNQMFRDVLDIINSKDAEIDRLNRLRAELSKEIDELRRTISEYEDEAERRWEREVLER